MLLSVEIWFSLCLRWSFYWLNTQPQQQENQALLIYSLPLNTSRIPFGLSSAVSQGALNANGITVIMQLMNTFVYVCKHFPAPHHHQEQGISTFSRQGRCVKGWVWEEYQRQEPGCSFWGKMNWNPSKMKAASSGPHADLWIVSSEALKANL